MQEHGHGREETSVGEEGPSDHRETGGKLPRQGHCDWEKSWDIKVFKMRLKGALK